MRIRLLHMTSARAFFQKKSKTLFDKNFQVYFEFILLWYILLVKGIKFDFFRYLFQWYKLDKIIKKLAYRSIINKIKVNLYNFKRYETKKTATKVAWR